MPTASLRAIHALYRKVYEKKPEYEITTGGLEKSDLVQNKRDVIVSKKRHDNAVKNKIVDRVKPWLAHVQAYYKSHKVDWKTALERAKATYQKGSKSAKKTSSASQSPSRKGLHRQHAEYTSPEKPAPRRSSRLAGLSSFFS